MVKKTLGARSLRPTAERNTRPDQPGESPTTPEAPPYAPDSREEGPARPGADVPRDHVWEGRTTSKTNTIYTTSLIHLPEHHSHNGVVVLVRPPPIPRRRRRPDHGPDGPQLPVREEAADRRAAAERPADL